MLNDIICLITLETLEEAKKQSNVGLQLCLCEVLLTQTNRKHQDVTFIFMLRSVLSWSYGSKASAPDF